jgi:hypothetical protein
MIWTGRTGKLLRDQQEARDIAFYLLTGPDKNLFGLFTVETDQIARYTGRREKQIHEAIDTLVDVGFCRWDDATGWVWVIEMAHYQYQCPLKPTDYRCGSAKKWYRTILRNPFLGEWWDRYARDFHLGSDPNPVERRDSYVTAPMPGTGQAPLEGLPQPRTEVQDPNQDLATSLFGEDLKPLRAREVDVALVPLSRAGVEESFERIWQAHPNGKQKKDALELWRKLKLTPALLETIETSHRAHVASYDWNKQGGQFCPRLVNWIKKQGWHDRVESEPKVIISEKNSRNVQAARAAAARTPFDNDEDFAS